MPFFIHWANFSNHYNFSNANKNHDCDIVGKPQPNRMLKKVKNILEKIRIKFEKKNEDENFPFFIEIATACKIWSQKLKSFLITKKLLLFQKIEN